MWVWVCVVHGCEDVAYSVWWGSKGGYVYQKVSGVGVCGCGCAGGCVWVWVCRCVCVGVGVQVGVCGCVVHGCEDVACTCV